MTEKAMLTLARKTARKWANWHSALDIGSDVAESRDYVLTRNVNRQMGRIADRTHHYSDFQPHSVRRGVLLPRHVYSDN